MGWVLFRSDSLTVALTYIKSMFGLNGNVAIDGMFTGYFEQNIVMLIVGIIICTPIFKILKEKIKPNVFTDVINVLCLVGLFVLSISSLVSNSYNPFIYFNF